MKAEKPLKLDLHGRLDGNSIKEFNKHCKGKGLFFASGFSCKKEHSDKDYSIIIEMVAVETVAMGNISEPKPPRSKVEYVKVEDSIWDLRPDFEAGELYVQLLGNSDEYRAIEEESTLIDEMRDDNVYRRIETQITERDEFIDRAVALDEFSKGLTFQGFIGKLYDAGCRFLGE